MNISFVLFVYVSALIIGISGDNSVSSQDKIVNNVQDLIKGPTSWKKCVDAPILGDSCVEVYTILPNLTLGISLTIGNKTYINLPLIEGTYTLYTKVVIMM
jgi:hypothetical protein